MADQDFTINDPGLGLVAPATSIPCIVGPASAGPVEEMQSFTSINDLVASFGQGQGVELASHVLAVSGGPVRFVRPDTSVAAANSAVTKANGGASSGTVTVAGDAFDDYEAVVTIRKDGTLGTGEFSYTLDGGLTESETLTIPAGGTYEIPNTNLTLTFVPGAGPVFFVAGCTNSFTATAEMWNATNLGDAVTNALLPSRIPWDFLVLAGQHATAAAAATIFAALSTHLATLHDAYRFVPAMLDGGADADSGFGAAFASVSDKFLCVPSSTARVASSKSFAGWATPTRPTLNVFAARAAANLISTDHARYASGSIRGVRTISYDDFAAGGVLDALKASTLRTYQGAEGAYFKNARMKSASGSDFQFWQHARVMLTACRVVEEAQRQFLSAGLRTIAGGFIDERDAARVEKEVRAKLKATLLEPKNAEGTDGHVSAVGYRILRDHNVLGTGQLGTEVGVQPLFYPKTFKTQLGFATNVVGAAA